MLPHQIHRYLSRFFNENNCQIINDQGHYLSVQLTIEMDKKIMNRPFYWQYVESTDAVPYPAQLTFITDATKLQNEVSGEIVHFGSRRLNQLFQVTRQQGAVVKMYESIHNAYEVKTILTPWLGVNFKVTYSSDQTKETLYSLGMNLMTGQMIDGFQEHLNSISLNEEMSPGTFNLPYTIKPLRALGRMELTVIDLIKQDDHSWIEEVNKRWKKDCKVLEYFYEGVENKPESYEVERQAMEEQYTPKIKIDIINGGMFYLKGVPYKV
ncbi:YqhG family protein [Sporosarcina oncorhynchi]|uniref:YqhG family protein n=1 Tax=Sporosarcina oncorhynchi TaxID=3056444 RepID=A0ABZ0L3I8_9BACL|nr:YqhG family protein [Sporosarcina sp. T2O-4]WOV86762.1 YqhG family protein [Sporosarcina sp. T2O-4]